MTGRRPVGTHGGAPLPRGGRDEQDEQDEPGGTVAPGRPVPAQRGPHRDEQPAPDGGSGPRPARTARRADGDGDGGGNGRRGGRAAARGATAWNRMPAVLPALGLPVLGALADELAGPGLGAGYAACAVLGPVLAALVSSRAGWWWVVSGAPVVTLAVAGGVDCLARGDKYRGAGLGTEGLKLVSAQFPWMLAALAAALLAVGLRTFRARRARRA
ncbi:hypothetical protein Kpho02_73530 [Kitasatospora phosalacinea]|uniref:DUF6542 domain-containing protein n=1 Tax=Kitasatospora phosalacinea TaxID=2065 RepID=A0A9W6QG91_9ACTN|nr:DUF6542 domain-containing protein [Kitasatospora phosalacinea]GLW75056.1 hypothetical protein Kpho02_73530 [Kitasatospora phosalacinea]